MQWFFNFPLHKNVENHSEIFNIGTKHEVFWRLRLVGMKIPRIHLLFIDYQIIIWALTKITIIVDFIFRDCCRFFHFIVIILHHIWDNFEHL